MTYRPDIDGLRAVAVLAVIGSHLKIPGMIGGFVGVDVFFVISGFLIGTLVDREVAEGRFSLVTFYERRFRRIFPALFAMLAITTVLALVFALPTQLESYARSLAATALSLSNIFFYTDAGYFQAQQGSYPLLHTWSLGVEEQFYLIFPPLVLAVRQAPERWRVPIFAALAAASLGVSAYGAFAWPAAVLIFARIDYSRALLIAGYVISLIWFVSVLFVGGRRRQLQLGVVPFGDLTAIGSMAEVRLHPFYTVDDPRTGLDAIVADFRADLPAEWERMLADCALEGMVVYHTKQLREALTGRVEVEHLSENNFDSLVPLAAYLRIKAGLDWSFALVSLPIVMPLLLVMAIIVRLESPGPAIFRQQRVGYRGQPFTVYKVRTMRQPSDRTFDMRESAITTERDPRVTRFGRFLRRTRLDELPQIFNVLRGEMSWIGPRPEAVALAEWYERELPFYRYRHVVRPGISGWAQVNQGHVAQIDEIREKLQNDFYYIKYFSPWLDVLIVIRTVGTILTGFGSR